MSIALRTFGQMRCRRGGRPEKHWTRLRSVLAPGSCSIREPGWGKRVRVTLLLWLRRLSRRGLGGLVFELDSVFKSADSLGQAGAQFRQLLRTEYQHGNSQNHQQVHRLEQTFKHNGELSPIV